jgi:uncharacterized protein YqhQ
LRLHRLLRAPALIPALFSAKDSVGGQALIEGVMMRGKEKVSWAVRKPAGDAVVESFPFVSITKRNAFCGIPVIRGVINLFESLSWGYKALSRSADIAIIEEEKAAERDKKGSAGGDSPPINAKTASAGDDSPPNTRKASFGDKMLSALSFVIAFAISIGLFMYAPMWVANGIPYVKDSPMLFNLTAGIVRITLFLIYMALISLWSEMRRVFEYHGAEHKTIFAYEDGKPLTLENIEPYTTLHPRCGTSFLILVAICSILLFTVIDALYIQHFGNFVSLFHRLGVHFVMIPLVAGTSYEFLKLSDRYMHVPVVGALVKPGLWLQKITTRKPDSSQIEIAVKALEAAL